MNDADNKCIYSELNSFFQNAIDNGLKYPKIHLQTADEKELVLSRAGNKSSSPGSISITSPGSFGENKYYGRLLTNGKFQFSKHETSNLFASTIVDAIEDFITNPVAHAKLFSQKTGRCCFCNTPIKTDESLTVGYGPICADNFNLPWGEKTGANEVEIELPHVFKRDSEIADNEFVNNALSNIDKVLVACKNGDLKNWEALDRIRQELI